MSREEDKSVDFSLPPAIRDFVFDLHDGVRRSRNAEDVQRLYEHKHKEITDKFFNQSTWPDAKAIAADVYNDEFFLALYSEMSIRYITTKLKPQLSHHIASWANYKKLFEHISKAKNEDFLLSTQWVYDIMQEFAYQFQGFCQFRGNTASHSAEALKVLQANRDAWALPEVQAMLHKLIKAGRLDGTPLVVNQAPVLAQFAYFATIELARLDCLLGDHASSLERIAKVQGIPELYSALPICHFNVLYHVGVCNMLLRRHHDALDAFSEIIMHVLRVLKPGAGSTLRTGVPAQLTRMLDKALSLVALLMVIVPSYQVEDPVREAAEGKYEEKMRRLRAGDRSSAQELFESACPKFISPLVPDYSNPSAGQHQSVFEQQSALLVGEVMQHVPFFQLRSFLGMYASVDLSKLARFMEMSEADLASLLLSYKHKAAQQKALNVKAYRSNDYHFTIEGGVLVVNATPVKSHELGYERYFAAGVRKHEDINSSLRRTFAQLVL